MVLEGFLGLLHAALRAFGALALLLTGDLVLSGLRRRLLDLLAYVGDVDHPSLRCESIGVFTYRSMHPTNDAITGRETARLDGGDVIRLHALLALGRLVGYLGALIKALEAVTRYARVVHEEVLATLIRGDEAVALLVAEPLYRSLGHVWSPPFSVGAPLQQKAAPRVEGGASLTIKPTSIYCTLTIPRAGPEPRKAPARPGSLEVPQ